MKVAIIGAGVSGLVVAHLLHRRHEITVFEGADYAGGHTNTVRVDTADQTFDVDTGFIVFNDRNYPRFQRLLGQLGVKSQPSTMSFSVSDAAGDFEPSWPTSIGPRASCSISPATTSRSGPGSSASVSRPRSWSA
jgi:predicted NAD/FAD-binding protein